VNRHHYEKHLERVVGMMSEHSVDALLLVEPAAVQYLTGLNLVYLGRAMPTVLTREGKLFLFALKLEAAETQRETALGDVLVGPAEPGEQEAYILRYLSTLHIRSIGVDYGKTLYSLVQKLTDIVGRPIDVERDLAKLRAKKDPFEVENILKAIRATEKAQARAKVMISEGVEEREIAAAAAAEILSNGAEWFSFTPLVASGARSAYPHGMPTRKRLGRGELVFVDLGARVDGYWSDVTRTYTVGHPSSKQTKLFRATNEAIEEALDTVRPGAQGESVDAAACRVLRGYGFGRYIVHGVGHGIGLTGGYPMLGPNSRDVLEEQQTITIEPGVYIPGYGGIRIEEDVLVTRRGGRLLTSFPRGLE
jgi:Xaa-Pro aminopeptidase